MTIPSLGVLRVRLFKTAVFACSSPFCSRLRVPLMMTVSPVISRETTMWRVWVGFNATHSFGLFSLARCTVTWRCATANSSFAPGSCWHLASHCCLAMPSSPGSIFSPLRFAESCWLRFSTFWESSSTGHSRSSDTPSSIVLGSGCICRLTGSHLSAPVRFVRSVGF